ncbi:prolipoprotein diacylglyceryl transferase [Longirhabdus pacifica]|uniref:prolipoprotein diacylglyceryl transferase n=1 Tax=Longirhabdus pacifica TaxID=2305227 RepID=UPI00100898B9|nr:prolipoprotein diacylglyceryl transferase [Longirhabdus pacifica]
MYYYIDPVLFKIGPISATWYGLILGAAALVGLFLAVREGKRFNIPSDFFMDLLLIGAPSAIVVARLYYVAFEWEHYRDDPLSIIQIWNGGIAIHGALIGAIIAAVIYTRIKGYSFWKIADICAPSLLIGQIIGRWGNFVNQEAHGGPVSLDFLENTLHLPTFIVEQMQINGIYYHPTFLYESLWNVVGLILLIILRRRSFVRVGEVFASYFIWYSAGRFFIEGLRTDSLSFQGPEWLASFMNTLWTPMTWVFGEAGSMDVGENIRMAQLISLIIILVAVLFIVIRRWGGFAKEKYGDPITLQK